jgi:hypothetical protein
MDVSKLIRDPKRVQAYLEELPNGSLVCKKPVKIYIPVRFAERGLAQIGIETYIVGVYAIVVEDVYYGVSMVNAMLPIEPTATLKMQIDGDEYYEFSFDAGSVVVTSTDLVKTDVLVYKIYDEIISKGRVPWYLGYLELGKIFDTALYHAGANIGANQEVTELIISMISRSEKDRNQYYRTTIEDLSQLMVVKPAFIPLRSVQYAATNTTNKLAGSYFGDALVSALVNPADRVERIESLLRA